MGFLRRRKRELSRAAFLLGSPWGQDRRGALCQPPATRLQRNLGAGRIMAGKQYWPGSHDSSPQPCVFREALPTPSVPGFTGGETGLL